MTKEFPVNAKAWLEAELQSRPKPAPQPKDSVTVTQFAVIMNCSKRTAHDKLAQMLAAGTVTREVWQNGKSGQERVYFLKKK